MPTSGQGGWAVGSIRWPLVTLRDGRMPNPIEIGQQNWSGTSTTIDIGRTDLTPANYLNVVLVVSNHAPTSTPTGWTHLFTSAGGPVEAITLQQWKVYAYSRAADTTTNVTFNFPSVASPANARGGIQSLYIDDTDLLQYGVVDLGGVTSTTIALDRVDPDIPSTFVVCEHRTGTGTPLFHPSWDFVNGAVGAGSPNGNITCWQYEGDPPSTTYTRQGSQLLWSYAYFELGTP